MTSDEIYTFLIVYGEPSYPPVGRRPTIPPTLTEQHLIFSPGAKVLQTILLFILFTFVGARPQPQTDPVSLCSSISSLPLCRYH